MIDLRSDTLSIPVHQLQWEKISNGLGDSAYDMDQYVNELEHLAGDLFGMESALFIPSGTMANQLAILGHTHRGDEVLTDFMYHINYFESSQTASICGVCLNTCHSEDGIITPEDITNLIERKPRGPNYATPRLLHLENTVSVVGGNSYSVSQVNELIKIARGYGLKIHIDGARIFNAITKNKCDPKDFNGADSLSFSLTKCLGCPYGSLLMGSKDFMSIVKKYKKWLGGTMHQIGYMAYFALEALKGDWRSALTNDHQKALDLFNSLQLKDELAPFLRYYGTNIININAPEEIINKYFNLFLSNNISVSRWTPKQMRIVTYPNVSSGEINQVCSFIQSI